MQNFEYEKEFLMYRDYVNNFLTIECWAEYYGITLEYANEVRAFYKDI